jgi:hypothetical protein
MSLHPCSSAIGGEIINYPQFDSTMIAHNLETPRVNDIFQYSMLMGMSRTERERSDEPYE